MNKSDYDKYYKKGGTYVIPVEIFNELFDELERQISNYEQALEDLDKKENIIKEVREYIEKYDFITGYYEHNYDDENDTYTHYTVKEELLEILDKNKLGI